jgi:hypothetical protein
MTDRIMTSKIADKMESTSRRICAISGKSLPQRSLVILGDLRPSPVEPIQRDFPDIAMTATVSKTEVDR